MATDTASHFTTEPSILQSRPGTALFNASNLTQKFKQLDLTYNNTSSTVVFSKTTKLTNPQIILSNETRDKNSYKKISSALKRP